MAAKLMLSHAVLFSISRISKR